MSGQSTHISLWLDDNRDLVRGTLLLLAAATAMVLANAPTASAMEAFWGWHTPGPLPLSLLHWTNDGLMALFFLLVGLEIKRELLSGDLSSVRKAMLPVAAAGGGMVVPALIYLVIAAPSGYSRGWGIPIATDIAFAVGVLALLGRRIPAGLRLFLVALAITDDLGAILVIAIVYSSSIHGAPLLGAAALIAVLLTMNRLRVKSLLAYTTVGAVLWLALLHSGLHATLAGVLLAIFIPAVPRCTGDSETVLERLEHRLDGWVTFLVLPAFALANAGVPISSGGALLHPVSLGIIAGLSGGKPVGIVLASVIAVRLGGARLPAGVRLVDLVGVALLAGIGFTVSIFIADLAFVDSELLGTAKLAILAASAISAIGGVVILRVRHRYRRGRPEARATNTSCRRDDLRMVPPV